MTLRLTPRRWGLIASALIPPLVLAGCSGSGPSDDASVPTSLTVVSHDSFALPDDLKARFAAQTGLSVTYVAPGNAGTLVNQLVLTKDSPLGDVVFGIDNTFAGRAIDAGVLSPYVSSALPTGLDHLAADDQGSLTPIDFGDVCLNADDAWFAGRGLALPQTLDDLLKPDYANLLVVTNPASSSPGLAFLAATVAAKGDPGYLDYWRALKANGVKVDAGWSDAYGVDFSGSSGHGAYPLVLSYASSPADELGPDGQPRTSALPATCFRQVEYAGVIAGAANPTGAKEFIDFLLSDDVQSQIPDAMYMSPASPTATLPADWARFTSVVTDPWSLPAATIARDRDTWIQAWTAAVVG